MQILSPFVSTHLLGNLYTKRKEINEVIKQQLFAMVDNNVTQNNFVRFIRSIRFILCCFELYCH